MILPSGWKKRFEGFVELLIDWTLRSVVTATIPYLIAGPYWDHRISLVDPKRDSLVVLTAHP
jgi:hypothetical protein